MPAADFESMDQITLVFIGFAANPCRLCVTALLKRDRRPMNAAPGETVGVEPVIEIGDIFEAARGKKPALPAARIWKRSKRIAALPKDPVATRNDGIGDLAQPAGIPREEIMLGKAP